VALFLSFSVEGGHRPNPFQKVQEASLIGCKHEQTLVMTRKNQIPGNGVAALCWAVEVRDKREVTVARSTSGPDGAFL